MGDSKELKVRLVTAMVFPVVMYGCESWAIKLSAEELMLRTTPSSVRCSVSDSCHHLLVKAEMVLSFHFYHIANTVFNE